MLPDSKSLQKACREQAVFQVYRQTAKKCEGYRRLRNVKEIQTAKKCDRYRQLRNVTDTDG